jgi:hypothetical protein
MSASEQRVRFGSIAADGQMSQIGQERPLGDAAQISRNRSFE